MPVARIAAVGSALPERLLTNADLERMLDTSDEWITTRTGIRARHIAGEGETTATLAADAGRRALEAADIDPVSIDVTIIGTASPDQQLPSTAAFVQDHLGLHGAAFDVAAACAGFIYGTELGSSMIRAGTAGNVLVIGTEVLSRFVDYTDRTTCILFGDGAGAAVLVPGEEPGVYASILECDGRTARLLEVPAGGSARPASAETVAAREHFIKMEGRE
ncbi:MAG TPA: beta-ketoacyl-ACP synthase 3, partial [Actinomycetota bacterium]|nr:beta-ketoacyl-ACP synthase 3 [Actinomycetota bacterium]